MNPIFAETIYRGKDKEGTLVEVYALPISGEMVYCKREGYVFADKVNDSTSSRLHSAIYGKFLVKPIRV